MGDNKAKWRTRSGRSCSSVSEFRFESESIVFTYISSSELRIKTLAPDCPKYNYWVSRRVSVQKLLKYIC
jgi:hypothetical protein